MIDTMRLVIQKAYRVGYSVIDGWWFDTRKKDDILQVNSIILDERIKREIEGEIINSRIDGRVTIKEGSEIINSTVRGPCIIGGNCIIEDSYIGPYTSIGDDARIVRSSIEYSIVLKGAVIEGVDRLEESLIGENARLVKSGRGNAIKLHIGDYSEVIL